MPLPIPVTPSSCDVVISVKGEIRCQDTPRVTNGQLILEYNQPALDARACPWLTPETGKGQASAPDKVNCTQFYGQAD
jgi:hypothetical protein